MATVNVQNLNLCNESCNSWAPSMYTYSSQVDSLNTITSSGYFAPIAGQLRVGDYLFISDATGLQSGKGVYYVATVDLGNKLVNLSPLISQLGSVSTQITLSPLTFSSGLDEAVIMTPNTGYIINNLTIVGNYYLILPSPSTLSLGNTITVAYGNNVTGVNLYINQNAGQQITMPDGTTTTTVGSTGYLILNSPSDAVTLIVSGATSITTSFGTTNVGGTIECL